MTTGRSNVTLTNVGPGFELLALGAAEVAWSVALEDASGADAAALVAETREPDTLGAARHAMRALLGDMQGPEPVLHLTRESAMPHVADDVTGAAAAAALAAAAWRTLRGSEPASADALVRAVALAEQRYRGLPRPAAARAALFGGLGVTLELHPPAARSVRVAEWHVAICTPDVTLTRTAWKAALPNQVPLMKAVRHAARTFALVDALVAGDADAARAAFEDAIVEPVLGDLMTGVHPALRGARRAGAVGSWMHAAGPTLCALAPSAELAESAAEAIVAALDAHATRCTRVIRPLACLRERGEHADD